MNTIIFSGTNDKIIENDEHLECKGQHHYARFGSYCEFVKTVSKSEDFM